MLVKNHPLYAVFCLIFAVFSGSACADHLGPVVIDKARTEPVFYCNSETSALTFAKAETEYLEAVQNNFDYQEYLRLARKFVDKKSCDQSAEITYLPKKIAFTGLTLAALRSGIVLKKNQVVESEVQTSRGTIKIWVFVYSNLDVKI